MNDKAQSQVEVLEAENAELREQKANVWKYAERVERRARAAEYVVREGLGFGTERDFKEAFSEIELRADKLQVELDELRERSGRLAADFDRREREAKAEAADAPSEQVQHREEGISLAFGAAAGDLRTALEGGSRP